MCDEEVAMRWRAYAAALSHAPVLPAPRAQIMALLLGYGLVTLPEMLPLLA